MTNQDQRQKNCAGERQKLSYDQPTVEFYVFDSCEALMVSGQPGGGDAGGQDEEYW